MELIAIAEPRYHKCSLRKKEGCKQLVFVNQKPSRKNNILFNRGEGGGKGNFLGIVRGGEDI